jgi:hypothetical protein
MITKQTFNRILEQARREQVKTCPICHHEYKEYCYWCGYSEDKREEIIL